MVMNYEKGNQMASMSTKFKNLREAQSAAKQCLVDAKDSYPGPLTDIAAEFVCRPDGDSDRYELTKNGEITHTKTAGWCTFGMIINQNDTPCIVSD